MIDAAGGRRDCIELKRDDVLDGVDWAPNRNTPNSVRGSPIVFAFRPDAEPAHEIFCARFSKSFTAPMDSRCEPCGQVAPESVWSGRALPEHPRKNRVRIVYVCVKRLGSCIAVPRAQGVEHRAMRCIGRGVISGTAQQI